MFGPRFSSLFTSRWMALLWAVWICLMAVRFVGGSDKHSDPPPADDQTAAAINAALGR